MEENKTTIQKEPPKLIPTGRVKLVPKDKWMIFFENLEKELLKAINEGKYEELIKKINFLSYVIETQNIKIDRLTKIMVQR